MLGHANTIITSSVYFDKNKIIIDCEKELDALINDIKPRKSEKNNISIIDIELSTKEYLVQEKWPRMDTNFSHKFIYYYLVLFGFIKVFFNY